MRIDAEVVEIALLELLFDYQKLVGTGTIKYKPAFRRRRLRSRGIAGCVL